MSRTWRAIPSSPSPAAPADVPSERLLDFCAHSSLQRSNPRDPIDLPICDPHESTALLCDYCDAMASSAPAPAANEIHVLPKSSLSASQASPHVESAPSEPELLRGSSAHPVREKKWFAYVKTRNFWIVLLLG